jgi:6-phosphogluconolactonase
MTSRLTEHFFDSRGAASIAAANSIAELIQVRLSSSAEAALIVTGGSSPAMCYAELAPLVDWSRVHVLLSDERWVPATDAGSNEKLVRENLLAAAQEKSRFHAMYAADSSPVEHCEVLNQSFSALPLPFVCTLLGLGSDGHFASLFPDADGLAGGLDINNQDWCIPVTTSASEHLRVSMTLAALLRSERIILLFFGEQKRAVYEQAKSPDSMLPVASLLSQSKVPVHAYWAE